MSAEDFDAGDWIDRMAAALPAPATAQEPYLREYRGQHSRVNFVRDRRSGGLLPFPLDDVRDLYGAVRHSNVLGWWRRRSQGMDGLAPMTGSWMSL